MNSGKNQRWFQLALGTVALFFAGIIYSWSILKAPFAEFGWSSAQLGLNYTITICLFCVGGFVSGLLSKKLPIRIRMLTSGVLLFVGFFTTSRLNADNLALLYVAYGVISGVGIGFTYNTVIGTVSAWFPDKKGLCSGILMMGFGFTSLILGSIARSMINTDTVGWRNTYVILAAAIGAVLILTAFLLKAPPAAAPLATAKTAAKQKKKSSAVHDYTPLEMIRRPSFWMLFAVVTLLAAAGSAAISFATDILGSVEKGGLGAGEAVATAAVGVLAIFNGLGRLVSGAMFDKLGVRKTQFITSGIAIAAPLVVLFGIVTVSPVLGFAGICLCGFSYGTAPTTSATFAAAFFGPKNFSLNFSIVNLILIPASFASVLAGYLKDVTGSFSSTFILLAAVSAVGLVVNACMKKA